MSGTAFGREHQLASYGDARWDADAIDPGDRSPPAR
jgi:hypothetical protein